MKYDISMTNLSLRILCLLACVMSHRAVRYGDYSAAHMPQYSDQNEHNDLAPGHDEYSDRSQDAPARLDYKYEEEPHGQTDDLPVKEIVDERIWDNSIKKKRKPSILRRDPDHGLDKYTIDETERELKSDKRFVMHRTKFRKRNFVKQSESRNHFKHNSIDQSDDIDNVENNRDYIHTGDGEEADSVDTLEINHFSYRSTTQRKPRRKPRDRALQQLEWRENNNNAKLEQDDVKARSDKTNFEISNPKRFDGIIHQEGINRKNNYDYDVYYDMKRVKHMKNRLPALLRQPTVRTMKLKSTSYSGHWLNGRVYSPAEKFFRELIIVEDTSAVTNTRTTTITTATTKCTSEIKVTMGNSSDLPLAEQSRLSILKKAQRKESSRNVSWSAKPPVLMQVTSKMQTMVIVKPRPPDIAMRAQEVLQDTPERLRRARRLMRHKLVASARSIHKLTDNWDEMICDYIDVSTLDSDAACYVESNINVLLLPFLLSIFNYN